MRIETAKILLEKLVNKQFEIAGLDASFKNIRDEKVGKKYWYEVYKFENEAQYLEWREYCREQIKKNPLLSINLEEEVNFLDLKYGMTYKIGE